MKGNSKITKSYPPNNSKRSENQRRQRGAGSRVRCRCVSGCSQIVAFAVRGPVVRYGRVRAMHIRGLGLEQTAWLLPRWHSMPERTGSHNHTRGKNDTIVNLARGSLVTAVLVLCTPRRCCCPCCHVPRGGLIRCSNKQSLVKTSAEEQHQ